ncbi:MAG: CHASE domain-containing protein [Ideonella sp.]
MVVRRVAALSLSRPPLGARAVVPVLVFLLGASIAIAAGLWLQRANNSLADDDFERGVERINREISRRFITPVYGLNGLKGLYAGNAPVDRAAFRAYVESRDLPSEFAGVRGFGFVERVTDDQLPAFIDAQQAGGAPGFRLQRLSEGGQNDYLIVKFIEPAAQNDAALGLDIASEKHRRAAAQQAIASGQPTITAPITLVQDQRRSPGVLLFVPVYRAQARPRNEEERRNALIGLLVAPIVIDDLLNDIVEIHRDRIRFRLIDSLDGSAVALAVFDSAPALGRQIADGKFSRSVPLQLPGRRLTLRVDSSPQFDADVSSMIPWAVFGAGLLTSMLLALLLQQQSTARSRAEALARQMTADLDRLALVARRTSNAVAITDAQRLITWVNDGFERITGYRAADVVGQPLALLRLDGSDTDTLRKLDEALGAGEPFAGTLVRHRSDGRPYWTATELQPLRDNQGQLSGFMAIESDISDRKRAEAVQQRMESDLRRNNELLSSILENLPCGLSVFDGDLKLVIANRQFRTLLRFPDHLFEQPVVRFQDFVRFNAEQGAYGDGDVDSRVRSIIDRARGSLGAQQLDRMPIDQAMLEIRSAPLPGGGFVSTYSDVSARIHAEAEVKRSAELLRGAIDAIGEAFVVYDADDRLVVCNDKYREIYRPLPGVLVAGASFEDVVRSGALSGRIPAAVGRIDEWVAERVAEHRAGHATLTQQLDDGRTLRVVDRKMADGHTVGFRIDITELTKATETAQAASHAKSQFLANTSHEIRTPMNAILGMLALLEKTGLTEQQADYTRKTDSAARALLGLLNDILDFSKIEAGKMALDKHPFSSAKLLRDLSVILSAEMTGKGVEVVFDIDPILPPYLVGDAMRLNQVLINLGSNAIKFTAAGEVVVAVKVEMLDAASACLHFSVSDTGIGIAAENQLRVFTAFTQGEASTTRRFGGTGLGLSISQRLVELMGGTLRVDSAVGQGSRFHFRIDLPIGNAIDVAQEIGAVSPPASKARRLAGLRLLVVEDNLNNQQIARELLEAEGASVQLASDGQQGVEAVEAAESDDQGFDLVLMDLQMPILDGFAAASRIRQDLGMQDLPIVAMTANAMTSDREACIAAGMNDHIGKPFDLDNLVRIIRQQVGRIDVPQAEAVCESAAQAAALAPEVANAAATAGIDTATAIARLGGRQDTYERMLRAFVKELVSMRRQLADLCEKRDVQGVCRLIHTLKGLAATFGATALSATAAQCESRMRADGSTASLQWAADTTRHAIDVASPALGALLLALRPGFDDAEAGPERNTDR